MNSGTTFHPSSTSRLFGLDVLRGIAVCLVLVRHAPKADLSLGVWSEYAFDYLTHIGWIGVDLFFVLSGFLISSLLFEEREKTGKIGLGRFWGRRGFKIWPSYYVAYGGMILLWTLRDFWRSDWKQLGITWNDALWNAIFIQNYVSCEPWPHSWSLAVEEHFYLILPVLLTSLMFLVPNKTEHDRMPGRLLGLIGIVCLGIMALRITGYEQTYDWKDNYYQSHLRFDSLLMGVAAACVLRTWTISKNVRSLLTLLTGFGLIVTLIIPYRYPLETAAVCSTWGFSFIAVTFAGLVLLTGMSASTGQTDKKRSQLFRYLAWIGVYSYTIYLAHSVLYGIPGMATARDLFLGKLQQVGLSQHLLVWSDRMLFWLGSIGLGILLSHMIERPFLSLRSRYLPSWRGLKKLTATVDAESKLQSEPKLVNVP